jgi:hypothetical protein
MGNCKGYKIMSNVTYQKLPYSLSTDYDRLKTLLHKSIPVAGFILCKTQQVLTLCTLTNHTFHVGEHHLDSSTINFNEFCKLIDFRFIDPSESEMKEWSQS